MADSHQHRGNQIFDPNGGKKHRQAKVVPPIGVGSAEQKTADGKGQREKKEQFKAVANRHQNANRHSNKTRNTADCRIDRGWELYSAIGYGEFIHASMLLTASFFPFQSPQIQPVYPTVR